MYWSVFLFPPAITWQRHLGGKWMSDVWCVCSSAVAPSVHWWVERWWGRGRDNAVINSVWTSSVCMQGSPHLKWPPPIPPLPPEGHRSVRNLHFLAFLVSRVCSRRVECTGGRNTCKRGSLVPADKRMLRVTALQLTLGFKKKSDLVLIQPPQFKPCAARFPRDRGGDQRILRYRTFVWQLSRYIFAFLNGMSDLILSIRLLWSNAFKVIMHYIKCIVFMMWGIISRPFN